MRHRVKVLAVAASTTALLVAGAAPGNAASPATGGDNPPAASVTAAPAAASYDGQTIFAGLMLGHGPVAEQYPDLVAGRVSGTDDPQLAEFSELVASAVENVEPGFFDGFGHAVTSGDRVQVDRALQSARDVLMIALTEELGGTAAESPQLIGVAVLVVAVVIAVAHVTFGAVLNVAVAANVAWGLGLPVDSASARIDQEKWVDRVAEALAS